MYRLFFLAALALLPLAHPAPAQDNTITIATVTRAPFSMEENGTHVGFSVELWSMLAADLGVQTNFLRTDSFQEMLDLVVARQVDGAIANISITAGREAIMDFSQPIFDSGLQIMLPYETGSGSIFQALLTRDIAIAVLVAIGMLFGGGMLMWVFERHRQPYFDRDARDALFPSFWWSLNLVVNGGFEERMPMSRPGRVFAVILVFASLFLVSVFVAKITAAMTVDALQSSVESINDLDGKRVGTLAGSTAEQFLDQREIATITFEDLNPMLRQFEDTTLDAVFFDGPILSYYTTTRGSGTARMVSRVFKPENYGMALPTGSPLREQINQGLLRLREDGRYGALRAKWFGAGN